MYLVKQYVIFDKFLQGLFVFFEKFLEQPKNCICESLEKTPHSVELKRKPAVQILREIISVDSES